MTKKKKIILIGVAVTLALVLGVGGLAQALNDHMHMETGGHKLIGVGEMGGWYGDWDQYQMWDTRFIITNPNCEKYLTIEWVALIAGDDVEWEAEYVIFEGTPDDWDELYEYEIGIPGELSPHEVWHVSIAQLLDKHPSDFTLGKLHPGGYLERGFLVVVVGLGQAPTAYRLAEGTVLVWVSGTA